MPQQILSQHYEEQTQLPESKAAAPEALMLAYNSQGSAYDFLLHHSCSPRYHESQ